MTTRLTLHAEGEAMREVLRGADPSASHSPGFDALQVEIVYGAVWSRPGLALADRMICTLAALGALNRLEPLRRFVAAALRIGLAPLSIQEVLIQAGLYSGFAGAEDALRVAGEVFAAHGEKLPARPELVEEPLESLMQRGRTTLEELHGERGLEGYASPDNVVTGAMYPLAVQYGYGEIWSRPGLDRRQRMLVAVAAFTALQLETQARKFGTSALRTGLSKTEVREAVIQTAPYSGFPRALNVLTALSEVLRE